MRVILKKKYRSLREPAKWINRAGFHNYPGQPSRPVTNPPSGVVKGHTHPIGFSGRTLGRMSTGRKTR